MSAKQQTIQRPIQRPKGTQDIVGEALPKWQRLEAIATEVLANARYGEIRLPLFEYTELFKRGVGEDTDIVNKEMYTFEKGDRSLTLRPEGTASVVRSYIEQGMSRWPKPVKLWYMGPMFRYERPQAGRQRQFHQLGVEVFGLKSPALDAEVIQLAITFLKKLGLPNLKLEINNIGDSDSRQKFREQFRTLVQPELADLCNTCQQRFETNPFRMLDCKNPNCQSVYNTAEVTDFLNSQWTSEASQAHFNGLTQLLNELEISYERNVKLVRGLDYYTDTVFEISSTHLGAQNAVCGGGSYDGLMSQLGGPETPGIGWAMGLERLIQLLPDEAIKPLDYYIVTDQWGHALHLAEQLRDKDWSAVVDMTGKAFGKQLANASKQQAKQAIILGREEVKSQTVQVKHLQSGEEQAKTISALLN